MSRSVAEMGAGRNLGRVLPIVGLLATAMAVAVTAAGSGTSGHEVSVVVPEAPLIKEGLAVRAGGQRVGSISGASVTEDRRARLTLRLDAEVWPLPVDSRMQLRWGGTIKFTDRYIELYRGRSSKSLPAGGQLPPDRFKAPPNFDDLLGTFDASTRRALSRTLQEAGAALGPVEDELDSALASSPPAFEQVNGVLRELGENEAALSTLVRSADRVIDAVQRSNPGLGELVSGAATTFRAIGERSADLERALAEAPPAVRTARATLARANGTLTRADRLLVRLSPGVTRLQAAAAPATGFLRQVVKVGPDARATLSSLREATPDLNPMLAELRGLMPRLESISRQGEVQVGCIRPYAPEIAGMISVWGPGAWGRGDGIDKYLRAQVGSYPFPNITPMTTGQVSKQFPQIGINFPQVPGAIVDKPWFQPQCHITEDSLDPDKDAEAFAFSPLGKELVSYQRRGEAVSPPGGTPPGGIDREYPAPEGTR